MTPGQLFEYTLAVVLGIGFGILILLFVAALMGMDFGSRKGKNQ